MSKPQFIHVLGKTGATALLAFALAAGAQPTNPPVTQAGSGRPNPPGAQAPSTVVGDAITNPQQFVENFTEIILDREAKNEVERATGRENEVRQLEIGLENNQKTVALLGDPKSGKTAVMLSYILNNPQDTVYRLDIQKIYELPSKEQQSTALKGIVLHLEKLAQNNTHGKIIFYVDNLPALNQGANDMRSIGVLIEAIAARRALPMVLETDHATFKDALAANKSVQERISVVEIKTASFDAVMSHLRRLKAQNAFHAPVSEHAMAEAARISLRYYATKPLDAAESLAKHAALRVYQELRANASQAQVLKNQITNLKLQVQSIQEDLKFQDDSALRAQLQKLNPELEALEAKLAGLTMPTPGVESQIADLRRQITEKEQSLRNARDRYFNRSETKKLDAEIQVATQRLRELELERQQTSNILEKPAVRVGVKEVQVVASEFLSIPLKTLTNNIEESIKTIDEIKKVVLNQDHLVDRAAEVLSSYRENRRRQEEAAKLRNKPYKPKPIWSVLIAGRTGTGKTEFTKQLAEKLGITQTEILRFDMTEFSEAHSVSRLIGSPPGYVGFDEGGQLTNAVRERPFRVILFDEVEKAHPNIFKVMMQVLDDARLTDGQGRTVNFEDTIIVMTTNAGETYTSMDRPELIEHLQKTVSLTPAQLNAMPLHELRNEAVKLEMRQRWTEAVVGRINDVMTTNSHTPEVIERIVHNQFKQLSQDYRDIDGIRLVISEAAMKQLNAAFRPEEGARSIENAFRRNVIDPLNLRTGRREFTRGDAVVVDFVDGQFDYLATANEQFVRVFTEGEKADAERRERVREALARRAGGASARAEVILSRLYDADYMVRNATAKALKRFRK